MFLIISLANVTPQSTGRADLVEDLFMLWVHQVSNVGDLVLPTEVFLHNRPWRLFRVDLTKSLSSTETGLAQ